MQRCKKVGRTDDKCTRIMGRFFPFLLSQADDWRLRNPGSIKLLLFVMLRSPTGFSELEKGARPDSTSNGRKGYLSSLLTVTRAKSISRMAGFLRCRNLQEETLRLFGTWNVSPCLSSTVQIGLALGQIYETTRTNKIGARRFFQFSMLAYDSRRGK